MEPQLQIALEKQNPWWFKKPYETGIPRLSYYPELQKYLNTPEILLILGARRTGKSTLLYQLISSLKASPEAILFINLDEPLFQSKAENPAFLSTVVEEYLLQHKDIQKYYIFIDEVQYLKNPSNFLKYLFVLSNVFLILLVGWSSIYLNVHWFSDVMAGLALGLFWLTFLILVFAVAAKLFSGKKL